MNIEQTLDYILKAIVTDSSSIKIDTNESDGLTIINVTASPEIVGQIIGRDGKIIKSIRTILNLTFPQVKYILNVTG